MKKLNALNHQYFWKDQNGNWDAFDDTDCIQINTWNPFKKQIKLLSKYGFEIVYENDGNLSLMDQRGQKFEVKKAENNDRYKRARPKNSSRN